MKKKQSSIEWLIEKLDQNFDYVADTLIEQAKAMHKEEIEDAWENGCDNGYDKACDNITWEEMDSAKDNYYTKTFGGNNE